MRLLTLLLGLCLAISARAEQDSLSHFQLDEQFSQAQQLIQSFQFDQAILILTDCLHYDEENLEYQLQMAYCYLQTGRYQDATWFYQAILDKDPRNLNALSSLGSIAERIGNYRQAEDYYLKMIDIDTSNAYYFKRAAYASLRLNEPFKAVARFNIAHQITPNDLETIDQLSDLYLKFNQLDYVEDILEKGLKLDQQNIKLLQNQARLAQKKKDYPVIVEAIQKTMVLGDSAKYYQMMIGVAYMQLDSLEQGIFHLERLVEKKADSEYTHHYLGLAYQEKEDAEKSAYHFEQAIAMGIADKQYLFHADYARLLQKESQFREAIDHYQKAYEYKAKPVFLFHLARCNDQAYADKRLAERYYRQYLESGHEQYQAYTKQRLENLKEIIHFQNGKN